MDYVTKKEFHDFAEKIDRRFEQVFLRFDHQDQMFGLMFKKLDHLEAKLDRNIERTDAGIEKMDARITSLEDWRMSREH